MTLKLNDIRKKRKKKGRRERGSDGVMEGERKRGEEMN